MLQKQPPAKVATSRAGAAYAVRAFVAAVATAIIAAQIREKTTTLERPDIELLYAAGFDY